MSIERAYSSNVGEAAAVAAAVVAAVAAVVAAVAAAVAAVVARAWQLAEEGRRIRC
jgi:hypothetical protein